MTNNSELLYISCLNYSLLAHFTMCSHKCVGVVLSYVFECFGTIMFNCRGFILRVILL